MPQQNWKEEFYKIGDGRVHFIATRQEVMHFMEKLLAQQRKEIVEEIANSNLGELMRFYESNRGSGHTYATVNGVANTPNAYLIVADKNQMQSTGLPPEKQIILTKKSILLGIRRKAFVLDHYALERMFYDIITKLSEPKL